LFPGGGVSLLNAGRLGPKKEEKEANYYFEGVKYVRISYMAHSNSLEREISCAIIVLTPGRSNCN